MAVEELRSLPIWRGEVEITPLAGGLTNLNYRVVSADGTFVARRGSDDPLLGIDRGNELACARAAAELGLAPAVVHSAPGVLVSAFVAGVPLTPELARRQLARVAATLRAIHAAGGAVTGHLRYFCAFQVARTYVRAAGERGLPLPDAVDGASLLAEIADLHARVLPFTPTFCHNDVMPGNLLDAGDRLWVIDWEYAGIGHPLFDVAGLASNCRFDDDSDRALVAAYCGDDDRAAAALGQFRVLKAMAALRESLWAVLQGAQSSIAFDYAGYRDDNFACYRRWRRRA